MLLQFYQRTGPKIPPEYIFIAISNPNKKSKTFWVVFNKSGDILLYSSLFRWLHCVQIRSFPCYLFSRIRTEYGEWGSKPQYSVRIRENTDLKNSVFGPFSSSDWRSELCQIPKMELFVKIVNEWKTLTIFAKSYTLDLWQGSK